MTTCCDSWRQAKTRHVRNQKSATATSKKCERNVQHGFHVTKFEAESAECEYEYVIDRRHCPPRKWQDCRQHEFTLCSIWSLSIVQRGWRSPYMNLYTRDLSPTTYICTHHTEWRPGHWPHGYCIPTCAGTIVTGADSACCLDLTWHWGQWLPPNCTLWCLRMDRSKLRQTMVPSHWRESQESEPFAANLCERRQPIPLLAEWSSVKFTTCRVWCPKRNLYSSLYFFHRCYPPQQYFNPNDGDQRFDVVCSKAVTLDLDSGLASAESEARTAQCVFQVLAWQLSSVRGLEQSKLNFYLSSWSGMAIYEITSILSLSHTISLYASIQYHIHVYI